MFRENQLLVKDSVFHNQEVSRRGEKREQVEIFIQ